MKIIKPPRLRKGDLISIVSPASPPDHANKIHKAIRYFESLGYRVTISENVFDVNGYLAGTDEERVKDLNQSFEDKNVRAIICSRGGYGTPRILDRLDYSLIRKNPKILVGYSDITALQLAIFKKTGLVTFSGPMMAVEFSTDINSYTEEMFFEMLTRPSRIGALRSHKDFQLSFKGRKKSSGRLLGGNLSLITSILGTRYVPDFNSSVLLIEEVSEEPYSIDRMLTQLRLARILPRVSAYALGQFTNCTPSEPNKPNRTLQQILAEDLFAAGKAAVSNIPYGHVPIKMTLPIGVSVSVDPIRRKFSIDETTVI